MVRILKFGSLSLIMVLMLSLVLVVSAAVDPLTPVVQKEISVKQGSFFELPLKYEEKKGYSHSWVPIYDGVYIKSYHGDLDEWVFKGLKKGNMNLTVELYELDPYGHMDISQTLVYPIKIT